MLKFFLHYLLFFQLIGLVHSQYPLYQYNGTQCADVYNFSFITPLAHTIIDPTVSFYMGKTFNSAPYIETACMKRLRKHFCMLSLFYNTSALTSTRMVYCQPECLSLAYSECSSFFEILPEDAKNSFLAPCVSLAGSEPPYCYAGSLSTFKEETPICPYPIVYPDKESYEGSAQREMVTGTACALPCPGLLFDEKNWGHFSKIVISLYLISTVVVSLGIYQQLTTSYKNFNVLMVCIGCLTGSFWMFIYHVVNNGFTETQQKVICSGNSGYIESDPFCIFCGFMLLVSLNWFASWSFFASLTLWLAVTYNYTERKLVALRPKMFMFAIFVSLFPVIPLAADNIGYEWSGGTLNFCFNKGLYTNKGTGYHYVVTFTPLLLLVFLLPLILLVDTIRVVTNIQNKSAKATGRLQSSQNLTFSGKVSKFFSDTYAFYLKNKRAIWFIFFFTIQTAFFLSADLHTAWGMTFNDEIEAALMCIIANASPDPKAGYNKCIAEGKSPFLMSNTSKSWTSYVIVIYTSMFGCFPVLVFSVDDLAKRVYNSIYGIDTNSKSSSRNNKNKTVKSNTHSSSEISSLSTNPLQSKSQSSSNEESVKLEEQGEIEDGGGGGDGGGGSSSISTTDRTISDVTLEDSGSLTLDVVTTNIADMSPNTIIELSSNIHNEI